MNKEQFLKELEEIKKDYTEHDWDGYGAMPLNKASAEFAEKFIYETIQLYSSLDYPELEVEPCGDLGFKWANYGNHLVVSIDAYGKISYCLRREDGTKSRGDNMYYGKGIHQFIIGCFLEILAEKEGESSGLFFGLSRASVKKIDN
jgi:hypothetical protein